MIDQAKELFLMACGARGPLVLGVEEPDAPGTSWRVFDQPFIVVGRDPGADLRLDHAEVGRRHAYFQLIAGRLFCVDLQSQTGTRWGDEPGLWGWVHRDVGIGIGPFRLRTREGGMDPPALPQGDATPMPVPISKSFVQPGLPEVTVEILSASVGSPTWRVSRSLVLIGSSPACRIRLEGGGVAEVHASILRTPSGVFAVDLLGKGGIRLGGQRVRCARIAGDVEIAAGGHRLRVRCGEPGASERGPVGGMRGVTGRGPGLPARHASGPSPPARAGDLRPDSPRSHPAVGPDTASLVRTMLDEFAQIQSRMSDQFQESLIHIVRAIAESQGERLGPIREELARIREATEGQASLRALVEREAHRQPGPPFLRIVSGEPGDSLADPPPIIAAPVPATDRRRPSPEPIIRRREGPANPSVRETQADQVAPPVQDAMHAQIAHRLAEIQDERQGRWRKLMKLIIE